VPGTPGLVREASAPRRWTAKGLAAAVMFVLIGGLVLMYAVPAYSQRETVLVVAKVVPIGARITAADLSTARITSDPALTPVPVSRRAAVLGQVAVVTIEAGTLLTLSELSTDDGFVAGEVLVPLALKPGQLPARGLSPGEQVLVVATPSTNGSSGAAGSSPTPTQGTQARVAEVGTPNPSSQITVVDVRVSSADGVALAQLGATGGLTVLLLPPGR
jgi:hypothetical protein